MQEVAASFKNKISVKYTKQALDDEYQWALVELKIEGEIMNMNDFKQVMSLLGYCTWGNPNTSLLQDAWEVM